MENQILRESKHKWFFIFSGEQLFSTALGTLTLKKLIEKANK